MYTLLVLTPEGQVHAEVPFEQGELLIGRSRGNNVVLPSTGVSRRHARLYTAHGRVYVEDLGSANGTLVDGRRVQTAEVSPNTEIRIGEFALYLKGGGGRGAVPRAATPAPAPSAVQAAATPPPPGPPRPQPDDSRRYARLVGLTKPFEGEEWVLSERENTIGRTEDNFILLPDPSVSRNHARIVRNEQGQYIIYDLRSSNGTAVNSKQVTQAVLRDGDLVSFGNVAFRFVSSRSSAQGGGPARSRTMFVLLGILVGAVFLGSVVLGVILLKNYMDTKAEQERQAKIAAAVDATREYIEARDWAHALDEVGAALEVAPEHQVLGKLRDKVRQEKEAKEALDGAKEAFEADDLDKAQELVEAIPRESVYHKDAAELGKKIRKKLDQRLLAQGLDACTHKKYKLCHELLSQYLDRNPDNAEAYGRLRYAESRMKWKRIKFKRWERPEAKGK